MLGQVWCRCFDFWSLGTFGLGLQRDRLGFTVEGLGLGLHLTSACTVPRRIGTIQLKFKIRISASHDRLGQASS